jgi:predicted DNA-binding WGR domain protein
MATFKASVEFKFFGWFFDPEKNNDKIWGFIIVEGKYYNFWGRRGITPEGMKKVKFKRHEHFYGQSDLRELTNTKIRKGYKSIDCKIDSTGAHIEIEKVYPGFEAHCRDQLAFARLTGTVKGEEIDFS